MNTLQDEGTSLTQGVPGQSQVSGQGATPGGVVGPPAKLRSVLDKDVSAMEDYLMVLESALNVSSIRYFLHFF